MTEINIENKIISVLGCGWFGLELAKNLIIEGYIVNGSSTTPEKLTVMQNLGIVPFIVNFQENTESFSPDFFDCDTLIICIPPKRNSSEQHTFLSKIERISNAAKENGVENVIFISSTSVYGDVDAEITEATPPTPDTLSGKAILAAEILLKKQTVFNTTIVRFGGLVGPGRDPGKFFAGKTDIPNGKAPVNLIHLSDCIGICVKILELEAFDQIYNACSPQHPTKKDFYTLAAQKSGLITPLFIDELQHWKLVSSENIPKHLNYTFKTNFNNTL